MNDLHRHLDWLNDKQSSMQTLLIETCDINSGTFNQDGLGKVLKVLRREFEPLCDVCEQIELQPMQSVDDRGKIVRQPLGQAIRFRKNQNARRKVFLCIHMDTVYSPDHAFQKCDPPTDGILHGPGVADAKGGMMVMLFALRCLAASPLAGEIGWEVLLNPDEEVGSPGSADLFVGCAERNDFGLLFEPAYPDGSLVSQRKGSGNFSFVVTGRSAHSGREFGKGRNAIVQAAHIVRQIHELNDNEHGITYNNGRITGGGPLNMVPDLAIVHVNVRVSDFPQMDRVHDQFARIVEEVNDHEGITCELHGHFSSPPKLLDRRSKSIQQQIDLCAAELDIQTSWTETGGASDGNKLFAAGLPNIDTMGVVGGNIHSDQEYVMLDSLVPRAKLTALMLLKFAASEFDLSPTD